MEIECSVCRTVLLVDIPYEWIELLESAKDLHGACPKSWVRLNAAIEACEKLTGERKPEVEA